MASDESGVDVPESLEESNDLLDIRGTSRRSGQECLSKSWMGTICLQSVQCIVSKFRCTRLGALTIFRPEIESNVGDDEEGLSG